MRGERTAPAAARVLGVWCILGVLALPAAAQYGGGVGTVQSPFLIFTARQLDTLGARPDDWGKHFKLMADIDLKGYAPDAFHIIGTSEDGPFTGVFNGNFQTISNLRQTRDLGGYLGLFGLVEGRDARIENLMLADPNIASETGRYVGTLIGALGEGTVSNCHVRAGGVQGMNFIGGLVGKNDGGTIIGCTASAVVQGMSRLGGLIGQSYYGLIERCWSEGEVLGLESSYWVGGLIGESREATVKSCRARCTVKGDLSVGGLLGENLSGTVDRCCAAGTVRGGTYAGGLLGLNSGGTISDCYATADVKATIYVGGLAGCNGPDCHCIVYTPGTIVRCHATGYVWGVNAGGLVGINDRSQSQASFWDVETTGRTDSAGGDGKSTVEMGRVSTFASAGWDFIGEKTNGNQEIWYVPAAGAYPRLMWELAAGDFDADGRVNFRDFSRLAAQWRRGSAIGSYAAPDGVVDFDDVANLADVWLAGRK